MTTFNANNAGTRFCMRWRVGARAWNVFGLNPDGSFWGETLDYESPCKGIKIFEGVISSEDYQRFMGFVAQIKEHSQRTESEVETSDLTGFLAEGTWYGGEPTFLFRRYAQQSSPILDSYFAEITNIMMAYV